MGEGDFEVKKYNTYSIYTMLLNDLKFDDWVQEGKDFVRKMEQ